MNQLSKRQPDKYISEVIGRFNDRQITMEEAKELLHIGKSAVYNLRTKWLRNGKRICASVSGGARRKCNYPIHIKEFIRSALEAQLKAKPYKSNFACISDELERLYEFKKDRKAIQRFAEKCFPDLVGHKQQRPKKFRRWQKEKAGALWQHDSTLHKIGPLQLDASMILTVDDATRQIVGISFVPRENLDAHFTHFRKAFARHGTPQAVYTDGFTMFGKAGEDISSQCGKMFRRLNIGHIIAASPQAKGKIERSIGTFERRLLALFNQYKVSTFEHANTVAQEVIFWWNENHVNRTTKLTPNQSLEIATMRRKTAYTKHPQVLLNIFVARHIARRVSRSNTIDFQGQVFQIAPTNHKMVYVVYHHDSKFWVIETEIDTLDPKIPGILACYETQNSTFERPLWKKAISEAYSK